MFGPKLYSPPVAFHFSVSITESMEAKKESGGGGMMNKLGKMAVDKALSASGALPQMDGRFSEVSGFSATLELPDEIKEAGNNNYVTKLPGRMTYSPLVLKRGLVVMSTQLGSWFKGILDNNYTSQIPRKNLVVSLLNESNTPLMTWVFEKAFPVKWELSPMNAMDNQLAFETIEIFYSKMTFGDSVYDNMKKSPMATTGALIKGSIKF